MSIRPAALRGSLLFVVATVIYAAGRAPFIGQWDSFDYLKQTVTHSLSDLGFGRPVYLACSIAVWECARRLAGLQPPHVEHVLMAATVLTGAAGVLAFRRFFIKYFRSPGSEMAALAVLLSPMYAVYSGFIMTEVPMLVAATAGASLLWNGEREKGWRELAAGALFGAAVGIREQAVTLAAAYVWIIWVRRCAGRARWLSLWRFASGAAAVTAVPIAALYVYDPAAFTERMRDWLGAIPMGQAHFRRNLEASLLFAAAVTPATWLAVAGAALVRLCRRPALPPTGSGGPRLGLGAAIAGVFCCLVLPLMVLWRDADVQMHPRYAIVALPASIVIGVSLYRRWLPSARAAVVWAVLHVLGFGVAQALFEPFRQIQAGKREYVGMVRSQITGSALIISGGYSPVFDYYRGIGVRPGWDILWSGWRWDRRKVEQRMQEAWRVGKPVYLCQGPYAWLYLEHEYLDVHFILKYWEKRRAAPGLYRVWRPQTATPKDIRYRKSPTR